MSNFTSWQQHEAFVEQYGEPYVGILDQCLGIIAAVANHVLSETEARTKALAIFEGLMPLHVPACHERIAAYRAGVAAQEAEEAKRREANMALQQQRRDAEAAYQKRAIEAADRAHRIAKETEERESKEHREKFDAEQRAIQAEKDRNEAEQAEALERRLLAAVDGDAE